MPAPRHQVRDAHTSCLYVCVYTERESVCVPAYEERERVCVCLRLVIGYAILIRLACVCECVCASLSFCVCVSVRMCVCARASVRVCIYAETECVCLRLIIGYAVLIRLACVCVCTYIKYVCVCLRLIIGSSGTRCSYFLPVPRLVLPRLAYHVEHQDKRIRRGVGVRAGGSQGRRELQAAADIELVTESCGIRRTGSSCRILGKHVHAVHSSVLIWLDSLPPSASASISGS